jgi:hypothetical protein
MKRAMTKSIDLTWSDCCLIALIPSSGVFGIETLCHKIESAKLHTHSNNVDEMLSMINACYKHITDQESTYEYITWYTLNFLLSGPNADFKSYIKRINNNIDSEAGPTADISFEELCLAARKKYLNMETAHNYLLVDPKNSRIMSLTTKLEALEQPDSLPPLPICSTPPVMLIHAPT